MNGKLQTRGMTSLTGVNDERSLLDRIRERRASLSTAQAQVAEFILENEADAAFMSAGELAVRAGVSEATAIRFAQDLGYAGYPEFREAVQRLLKETLTPVVKLSRTAAHSGEGLLRRTVDVDIEILNKVRSEMSESAFEDAVQIVVTARRVHILALGISHSIASFLDYRFSQSSIAVNRVTQSGRAFFEELGRVDSDDAVVAAGFYRCADEILVGVEYAREQGAKVVAITDSVLSSLGRRADVVLPAKRGPVEMLNSLAVPMAVANALAVGAAMRRNAPTVERLEGVELLFDRYLAYCGSRKASRRLYRNNRGGGTDI
jgi:DNA-binding MurR/RpiR family transcriptional regulator